MCSSSGGQNCFIQHLVSSHSVGVRPVHMLKGGEEEEEEEEEEVEEEEDEEEEVFSPPAHRTATYRCDNTRYCIIQF